MNKEQFNIGLNDPELPQIVKDASKNHGGMTVPENFFADFEQKMNKAIDAEANLNIGTVLTTSRNTTSLSKRWSIAAAVVAVIAVIGVAFQFNWVENQLTEPENFIADVASEAEEEINPADDIYYTSLSDYEVYDLICGI